MLLAVDRQQTLFGRWKYRCLGWVLGIGELGVLGVGGVKHSSVVGDTDIVRGTDGIADIKDIQMRQNINDIRDTGRLQ